MTALSFLLGGLLLGPLFGAVLFALLAGRVRARAYQVCQAQDRVLYGLRPAVGVNPDVPYRRRSPDHQLVSRVSSPSVSIVGEQAR